MRAVDAGPLAMSKFVEDLTALLLGINRRYKTQASVQLVGVETEEEGRAALERIFAPIIARFDANAAEALAEFRAELVSHAIQRTNPGS